MTEHFRSASESGPAPQGERRAPEQPDYGELAPHVAQQAQAAALRIREMVSRAVATLIAIGGELLAVKEALPHGSFGPWVRAEFGWTERTARNFMNVAQRFGPQQQTISDLAIEPTALYLLAAPSAPETARQEAMHRAQGGEKITPSVAREIIAAHRGDPEGGTVPPRPPANKLLGELLTSLESFRERWGRERASALARELREFADSLEEG